MPSLGIWITMLCSVDSTSPLSLSVEGWGVVVGCWETFLSRVGQDIGRLRGGRECCWRFFVNEQNLFHGLSFLFSFWGKKANYIPFFVLYNIISSMKSKNEIVFLFLHLVSFGCSATSARRRKMVASEGQFGNTGDILRTTSLKWHRRWRRDKYHSTGEYWVFLRRCFMNVFHNLVNYAQLSVVN